MPNWCVNQVDVIGDEAEVARLVELVKGTNEAFDFAKIIPTPDSEFYAASETQNHFQCGCKDEWVELTDLPKVERVRYVNGEEVKEMVYQSEKRVDGFPLVKTDVDLTTANSIGDLVMGGKELCPNHLVGRISSHPDWWYNWNVANWGTKWSASDVWHDRAENEPVAGKTSYGFDTAWSPAEGIVAALAQQFPTLRIEHRYCEGGMSYAGEAIYEGGDEVARNEYSGDNDNLPDEAWLREEDGSNSYERDYEKVPMTAYEAFCDEHFGGVVGG